MAQVLIHELFRKRALVTRESARSTRSVLMNAASQGDLEIIVDFGGVDAVTPSFLDELLRVVQDVRGQVQQLKRVRLVNVPVRVSPGYVEIGRSHGTAISEAAPNASSTTWEVGAQPVQP
jgi:STAS-like domain of unknown function (DUF4325)